MKTLVDANIFLAVVMNEPAKKKIISSTLSAELISPEILPYEVGNALTAMLKRKRISPKDVNSLFNAYESIPVRLVQADIQNALNIATNYNIYAYDAYYLDIAKRLKLPILTLDTKMKEIASDLSIRILEV